MFVSNDVPTKLVIKEVQVNWITAFTQDVLDMQVMSRMADCGKEIRKIVSIDQVSIPNDTTHQYVGWDQGKISEVGKDRPLFTTELGPCLGILARAFQNHSEQVTHTALHHLFMRPDLFGETLKTLCEKVQNGTIEIFVTGGLSESRAKWFNVVVLIEKFKSEYPAIQFERCEDLFGLCEIGKPYKRTTTMFYPESVGLKYVGFDTQHNPFQIVDVTHEHNAQEPFEVIWFKG